jgi:hypothetical protein
VLLGHRPRALGERDERVFDFVSRARRLFAPPEEDLAESGDSSQCLGASPYSARRRASNATSPTPGETSASAVRGSCA